MTLRPRPARWFELLAARVDLEPAVEALAATGAVQLQTHGEATTRETLPDLHDRLRAFADLAHRYRAYWPKEGLTPSTAPGAPGDCLDAALAKLRTWAREADPIIESLQALETERGDLTELRRWLEAYGLETPELGLLAGAGPVLAARLLRLPPGLDLDHVPAGVIYRRVRAGAGVYLLLLGAAPQIQALEGDLTTQKARPIQVPPNLPPGRDAALVRIDARLAAIQAEVREGERELARLHGRHDVHRALGDVARLDWFVNHVHGLPVTENFAWVSGWTSDLEGRELRAILAERQVRALLRFPPAPQDQSPPLVLVNPRWARPFELFARLLGMPGANEADPSQFLALIAPLLFGYMFGDVGQGLVLLLVGLHLRRRLPPMGLLVPGGVAAMGFGLLFGSVFGMEDLIPPLWVSPLERPLPVLIVPVIGGAVILLLGLVLNGLEAAWRGAARPWWRSEAGLILLYVSVLGVAGGVAVDASMIGIAAGLLWYVVGRALGAREHLLNGLAAGLGSLAESALQLGINTVSFARVGAFALAHSGLGAATVGLAEVAEHPLGAGLILVIGNLLVIALEGLVVSIQTTRLVLFEFFVRFLRGEGRVFEPLPAPPAAAGQGRNQR
jgi:V/A-type H+-transporting ATPase subunit I